MTTVRLWTGREATLLRAALRLSIRDFAAKLGVDVRTVTKWQARGVGVVLRPHMQAVLDTALEHASEQAQVRFADMLEASSVPPADAAFGLYSRHRRPGNVRPVNRQEFLRTSSAVMMLPLAELFTSTKPAWVPAKTGRVHIEQVNAAASALSSLDNRYGGEVVREAAFAQLRWSAQLLQADCPNALRSDLFTAVARLAQLAGFTAADADAHQDSRRAFGFGLACAEQSGNRHVRASLLGDMALQAIWSGRLGDSLTHINMALADADQLTATERARLQTVRARVLARLHRTHDALAAVGAGDDAFAQANPADEPPWMPPYDEVWHQALTGHALLDLAIAGRRTEAGRRLKYAAAQRKRDYARLRAVSRAKYATLLMATGDPRQAAAVGHQALDEVGTLRSRRAIDDLRTLERFAGRYPQVSETVELRRRIGQVIDAR